jgi:hypothetical protein
VRGVLFAAASVLLFGGGVFALLRGLHPEWWRIRAVRRAFWALPVAAAVSVTAAFVDHRLGAAAVLAFFFLLALFVTLPVSGLLAAIARLSTRRAHDPSRREILVHATAAIPGAAIVGCAGGAIGAFAEPIVRRVTVPIERLPAALEGLRIFHLTDPHLGRFFGIGTLEHVLERVARERPDLVLMTGDFSDDATLIEPALRLVQALRPRLGLYASLGNHEYYLPGGAATARRAFDRAGVPLLVDECLRIRTGTETLCIAAANDPAFMGFEMAGFLSQSIDRALASRGTDDVTVLLSHRPDGFDAAARHDVGLTLSGHTHGGQIGIGGRSVFEPIFPHWYLRGLYERRASTLYTSTGFGHWLPLRIDCPAEAPVLVLRRRGIIGA